MIGLALFAMFALAITGLLIQAARLDAQEEVNTQVTAVAQQLLEEQIDKAREYDGYDNLQNVVLGPTSDSQFLYSQKTTELAPGLKKVQVSLFFADPEDPTSVDTSRPRHGESLTLSVVLGEPNR